MLIIAQALFIKITMFKKIIIFFVFTIALVSYVFAQNPPLIIKSPTGSTNKVSSTKQFIIGNTCADCKVTINNIPVKVYSTGSFAMQLNIQSADTSFTVTSTNDKNKN